MEKQREIFHVLPDPDGGGWKVEMEGGGPVAARTPTREPAVSKARELAKRTTLGLVVVHERDGTVEAEYRYGEDPRKVGG